MQGFIRVYFLDDSWATIPAKANTPAKEICDVSTACLHKTLLDRLLSRSRLQTISKKRNLNTLIEQYSLYMVESNHDREQLSARC